MELILVRHAKAFERDSAAWPDDARRPLTADGRERFRRLARRLRRSMPPPELVESSRFLRAWQTAALLHEEAGWPKPVRCEGLESERDGALDALRRSLRGMKGIERVAWVGHEPQLGRLASFLLTGDPVGVAIDFRKGSAMFLELPDRGGAARLKGLLTIRMATARRERRRS